MKKILLLVLIIVGVGVFVLFNNSPADNPQPTQNEPEEEITLEPVEIVAENLEIPWGLAFLPDGDILVTERPGRLTLLGSDSGRKEIAIEGVKTGGEGGLLGLTLHPQFQENGFIYIYLSSPGTGNQTENRVERYKFTNSALTDKTIIISGIPGAQYHDGGRLEFGPDGLLYITTGDATTPASAQDLNSLAGKILRLNDDGSIPADNPFVGVSSARSEMWSYGHRNPQGLTWDSSGNLWQTEHGPSSALWPNCCQDEINLIEKGENYGWPESVGDKVASGTESPALHSGRNTWAPASAAYLNGSVFFGGLRGEALYEAVLDGVEVKELKTHFFKEFGRIRTVRVGPDNLLYITTSNSDGRGGALSGNDKIIRIDPVALE